MSVRAIINMGEVLDSAVGISVFLRADGGKDIAYCILKKKKDTLSIHACKAGFAQFDQFDDDVKTLIDKNCRLHINITGRPVLTKSITTPASQAVDFNKLFPGLKKEDFLLYSNSGQVISFHSLIRRDDVLKDNLFYNEKIHSISLGYSVLENIASFINDGEVITEGNKISFKDNNIIGIEPAAFSATSAVNLLGVSIANDCILAYASAVSLFVEQQSVQVSGLPPKIIQAPHAFKAKRHLFAVGKIVLTSVLVLLIANAAAFFWISEKVSEAEAYIMFFQGSSKRNNMVNKKNLAMTTAYDNIGWRLNRLPLYYTDQLAGTVPAEIQLNTIETGTLKEFQSRQFKKLSFDPLQVRVTGVSSDPVILSNWIATLQKNNWVNRVKDQKYQYDQQIKKGLFEFSIEVK